MKANILLDEKLEVRLDPSGKTISTIGNGKLSVNNPSEQTTLWAITLGGTFGPDVRGFEEKKIPHIQNMNTYNDEYILELESKLVLSERIDTYYTGQTGNDLDISRNTLIKGIDQKVLYELQIINRYDFPISNIVIRKEFDTSVNEFEPISPHPGIAEIETNKLIWKIDELDAGESVAIDVVAVQNPNTSDKVKTGDINLTGIGTGLFSSFAPTIDAECDNVDLSVNVNETSTPGEWNVITEFTNLSEFATKLENVKVGNNDELFLDETINEMYEPSVEGPAWKKEYLIKSVDYPTIDKNFKYQVDFEVTSKIEIEINKETDLLNVVEVTSNKTFDPEHVNTYTRTPFNYTVEVKNVGTADIGKLHFDETIPPFILIKSVTATLDENLTIQARIEDQDGLDTSLPENLKSPRKLFVDVNTPNFSTGRIVTLNVNCIAEKPKPNLDYHAESIVNAFANTPTKSFEISSKMGDQNPELIVLYKMRSFKFSANYKSVSENEYEITIPIENNGEVPLENIYVTQGIMGGSYSSHTPLTIRAEEKADKIEFYIKQIPVKETVSIVISVATNGPIRQTQPSIRIAD